MAESSSQSTSVAVIAAIAGSLATAVIAFVPDVWKSILGVLKNVSEHAQGVTSFPNWSLYLLGGCTLYCLFKIVKVIVANLRSNEVTFKSYIEDYFFNATWRWNWSNSMPNGIWAFCPVCDTQLVYSEYTEMHERKITLTCEHCRRAVVNEDGYRDYLVAKVSRQIDRKIRNGDWKNRVTENRKINA
jgi:hypothetical protein